MLDELAQLLYNTFVVNRRAIAVQKSDGNYITRYTNVTKHDVYTMLKEEKSIGTYQQLYKSPYLKWICLDFDCRDKDNPNLEELYRDCIFPINKYLKTKQIKYLNEFSGRRGIHIWILFDKLLKKNVAYNIIQKIISDSGIHYDENKYGLDKFPANGISKNNIVGKQVKIPLSKHKKGQHSFFFQGDFSFSFNDKNSDFFETQLSILKTVEFNNIDNVISTLEISECENETTYKRILFEDGIEFSIDEVIKVLSSISVYRCIFERLQYGQPLQKDWFVLLGTFGRFGKNYDFLLSLLRFSPCFSEEQSKLKIQEFGNKYFPATFKYLYDLYDLDIESFLDPNQNALQYLAEKLNKQEFLQEYNFNEELSLESCRDTITKEKNYLLTNDEVPVISIYLDLSYFSEYDMKKIDNICNLIIQGEEYNIEPKNFLSFNRYEDSGKERRMISLSAFDRVITTHLALKLFYRINKLINSFSYNPNYLSKNTIFFHWFPSWGNYLENIRKYLDIDLYENNKVITLDITKFYDSVDFLGVYKLLQAQLSNEEKNIMQFLIHYNELLMQKNGKSRIGVPQGPAYARLIAESFLGIIINRIKELFNKHNIEITIYRYVDDIIIFCPCETDAYEVYKIFENELIKYGLKLNSEESKLYGQRNNLTKNERDQILRKGKFQYFLNESDFSYLIPDSIIQEKVDKFLLEKGELSISDISYFFSNKIDRKVRKLFFDKFGKEIFMSNTGRGSNFNVFYNFVFNENDILEKCLNNNYIEQISKYDINISSFISAFYFAVLNTKISNNQILKILNILDNVNIESDQNKSIIEAIKKGGITK